jgi:hypothetical protein
MVLWCCGLQIISAVLNTVGIANVGAQNTGGTGNTPTVAIVSDLHFFTNFEHTSSVFVASTS